MVWIREVVVVIGVDREGGQRRGEIGGGREEIGRTTNGLEVKKMIGRVRAGWDGEIEVWMDVRPLIFVA